MTFYKDIYTYLRLDNEESIKKTLDKILPKSLLPFVEGSTKIEIESPILPEMEAYEAAEQFQRILHDVESVEDSYSPLVLPSTEQQFMDKLDDSPMKPDGSYSMFLTDIITNKFGDEDKYENHSGILRSRTVNLKNGSFCRIDTLCLETDLGEFDELLDAFKSGTLYTLQ